MNALADELRWRSALNLFGKMRCAGHRPDVATCARVIRACEKTGQWRKALEVLDELRKDDYDFYELALFDQIFKKLLEITAMGVRSFGRESGRKGAGGYEEEDDEEEELEGLEDVQRTEVLESSRRSSSSVGMTNSNGRRTTTTARKR